MDIVHLSSVASSSSRKSSRIQNSGRDRETFAFFPFFTSSSSFLLFQSRLRFIFLFPDSSFPRDPLRNEKWENFMGSCPSTTDVAETTAEKEKKAQKERKRERERGKCPSRERFPAIRRGNFNTLVYLTNTRETGKTLLSRFSMRP